MVRLFLFISLILFSVSTADAQIIRESVGPISHSAIHQEFTVLGCGGQAYNTVASDHQDFTSRPGFIQDITGYTVANSFLSVTLYPNPGNMSFQVSWQPANAVSIQVLDCKGSVIHEQFVDHPFGVHIDCEAWPSGIYFVRIGHSQTHQLLKFVKY